METPFERGCGLNTTVFPPASIAMELQITVSVGFVVGAIAPITPNGQYSTNVSPSSPDKASVVKSSTPGDLTAAKRFLNTSVYQPWNDSYILSVLLRKLRLLHP